MSEISFFTPFKLGKHTVKNRILVPPLSDNQSERNGRVTQNQYDQYLRVAKQGAGTIILDSAYISQQGRGLPLQLGISEEDHISGIKNLVRLIKENEVLVGLRLSHAGAKTNHKLCGETPIGPSVMHFGKEFETCREFDEHDVKEICTFFGHAAERAEEAGLDFIEINGGQNLLLDQCLNSLLNNRDDKYGGDIKGRMQFAVEIIRFIKKRIDNNLLISFMFSSPLDRLEEEAGVNELQDIIKILNQEKVDIIHPILNHATQRLIENDVPILNVINKNTNAHVVVDGGIKSTLILKELSGLNQSSFYSLDKSIFTRQNWFNFIHKKLISA